MIHDKFWIRYIKLIVILLSILHLIVLNISLFFFITLHHISLYVLFVHEQRRYFHISREEKVICNVALQIQIQSQQFYIIRFIHHYIRRQVLDSNWYCRRYHLDFLNYDYTIELYCKLKYYNYEIVLYYAMQSCDYIKI